MAKKFTLCPVCDKYKFLNSFGVCKKCKNTDEGLKIVKEQLGE